MTCNHKEFDAIFFNRDKMYKLRGKSDFFYKVETQILNKLSQNIKFTVYKCNSNFSQDISNSRTHNAE